MILAFWDSPVNFVRVLTTAARVLHSKQCEDHIGDAYLRMSDALTYALEKSTIRHMMTHVTMEPDKLVGL